MTSKMIIISVVLFLGILFFAHMRFACTGIYRKALVMYSDESGRNFEKVECRYVGWKNFKFKFFKKWFDNNSLL